MSIRIRVVTRLLALALSLQPLGAGAGEIDELLETLSIESGCIQQSPARCGVEQLGADRAPFVTMAVDVGMEQGHFHMIDGMCGREAYWRCRLGSHIREIQSVYKACMTLFIKHRGAGK